MKNPIIYIFILFFLAVTFVTDTPPPPSGWTQQFMPDLGGRSVVDITFTDSLSGYAIVNRITLQDTSFILRTTNKGDNWFFAYADSGVSYNRIQFINQNTGFVCGRINKSLQFKIVKTTNAGLNWIYINAPFDVTANDIHALSDDTIWFVGSDPLTGGVFYTSNGGASWIHQINLGGSNPDRIYMYNARIGFVSRTNDPLLRKTTNGGQIWNLITGTGTGPFRDMYFIDSLTGWKCKSVGGGGWLMGKTTDGGFNWINQQLPTGGNIAIEDMEKFYNVNKDTIWGVGAYILYPGNGFRGMIYRTTNGGDNWLFQVPDTSIRIGEYNFINFTNKLNGWAYSHLRTGVHTVTGGDPIWYTGIQETPYVVPEGFVLKQNYPNPFNPRTVIPYSLSAPAHVKIIAYDITGREVQRMVDNYQQAGAYEVDFMGKFTASGVYFYRMTVDDKLVGTKKMVLIK